MLQRCLGHSLHRGQSGPVLHRILLRYLLVALCYDDDQLKPKASQCMSVGGALDAGPSFTASLRIGDHPVCGQSQKVSPGIVENQINLVIRGFRAQDGQHQEVFYHYHAKMQPISRFMLSNSYGTHCIVSQSMTCIKTHK